MSGESTYYSPCGTLRKENHVRYLKQIGAYGEQSGAGVKLNLLNLHSGYTRQVLFRAAYSKCEVTNGE